ncbi:MAG TPA: zf-HC2 domain-containing protein, partial [Pyrinomonadaceae bacterium]|nr:zf-HC2 domain-containing protein [Pyrinomonadaceae bacterium]
MHKPILDGLESYLSGHQPALESEQFSAHLATCPECRAELDSLQAQAEMMRLLRAPVVEPAPGFYARVMERIESQTPFSLWSIFLEPAFGTRVMVAALGLFVVLA